MLSKSLPKVQEPIGDKMNGLLTDLQNSRIRPRILSIISGFSDEYVLQVTEKNNP